MSETSNVESCLSLCSKISEICWQPLESITAHDMSVARRLWLELSVLALRVQMDMAKQKLDYNLEQWETIDTLATKMKKSVSFAKEAGKYQADKLYGEYTILEQLLRWVDRVLNQLEWFSVQWNVMVREQWAYLSTWLKDVS